MPVDPVLDDLVKKKKDEDARNQQQRGGGSNTYSAEANLGYSANPPSRKSTKRQPQQPQNAREYAWGQAGMMGEGEALFIVDSYNSDEED